MQIILDILPLAAVRSTIMDLVILLHRQHSVAADFILMLLLQLPQVVVAVIQQAAQPGAQTAVTAQAALL
jgi:hypothetical protein